MQLVRHIKTLLLITLLSLTFSSGVNAKPESGVQNLAAAPHQGEFNFNPLMHQGIIDVSTIDMPGYTLGPKSVRHGPTNPGSLTDDVAATFRGGSYTAKTTSETTTLYRVYGGSAGKLGPYWTRTKPSGPLQSQLDSALNPQWGNC